MLVTTVTTTTATTTTATTTPVLMLLFWKVGIGSFCFNLDTPSCSNLGKAIYSHQFISERKQTKGFYFHVAGTAFKTRLNEQ